MEEDRMTQSSEETEKEENTAAETEETEKPGETAEQPDEPETGETVTEEEAAEAVDAEFTSVEEEKKTGFFRKKDKKDKKDEKIEDLMDRLQRQMAEFDNFRKRTEKEKSVMYDGGARDVIEKILPVVDNFERGLAGADEDTPFVDGMNKIYKQLVTVLTDLGVTPIEAVGQTFDPNYHNAVMHEDNPDAGENEITQELQKGYMYKDTVLRYSMVKVAN